MFVCLDIVLIWRHTRIPPASSLLQQLAKISEADVLRALAG